MLQMRKMMVSTLLSLALLTQPFGALPHASGWTVSNAESAANQGITVAQAQRKDLGESSGSRIAGIVWHDANANGKMDDDETVLSGVRIILLAGASAMTDATPEATIAPEATPEHTPTATLSPEHTATSAPTATAHVPTAGPTSEPAPPPAPAPQAEPAPEPETVHQNQEAQEDNAGKAAEEAPEPEAEAAVAGGETTEIPDVAPPLSDGFTELMSGTSDSDGWYCFEGMLPGDYVLAVDLDSGLRPTEPRPGQSAFDPLSYRTNVLTLAAEDAKAENLHLGIIDQSGGQAKGKADAPDEPSDPGAPPDPEATLDPDATSDPEATLDPEATMDSDATPVADEMMAGLMMDMLGVPVVQMVEGSFLTIDEYLDLQSSQPQTFEYLRSLFGAEADLTQVTLEQAQSIAAFHPAGAGVSDMRSTGYLARMGGLTSINLSNQPLSNGFAIDAGNYQNLGSLNLSGCGGSYSIPAGALPSLTALNVDGASSVSFEAGALADNGIAALTISGVGDLSFGTAALGRVTTLTLKGGIGSLSIGAGALPAMTTLDMSGASISDLRLEDGAGTDAETCVGFALNTASGLKFGGLGRLYIGAYALPKFASLNLANVAASSITFGDNALPTSTAGTLTLSNAALTTLTFGANACNAVNKLVMNVSGGASLSKLSVGSNSLVNITTNALDLSKNTNLASISLGSGALSKLQTLTVSNTGLTDLDCFGTDALPALITLNALNLPATSVTVPSNALNAMKTLDLSGCVSLKKLTFADDSAAALTSLRLSGVSSLTEMHVGDRAMKAYVTFSLASSPYQMDSLTVGDESLNKATTFNVGSYMRNLAIGKNSLNACGSIAGINVADYPLERLSVGEGSFSAATYTTLNLSKCAKLTSENLSIKAGAFPNVKTLTLDNSGILNVGFLTDGALSAITVLNWKATEIGTLSIPANLLPNLLTLDLSNNARLASLEIGAGAMPIANKLTLLGCTSLSQIACGSGAMGALATLTTQALSGSALTVSGAGFAAVTRLDVTNSAELITIAIGDGALPKLNSFTVTGAAALTKLNIGEGALNATTTLGLPVTLEALDIGAGALKNLISLSLVNLTKLTGLKIGAGSLSALTSLTLTNTSLTTLTIDEGALPELLALVLGGGTGNRSNITSLTIGDNTLNKLTTLAFATYANAPLEELVIGANALGSVKALTLSNNALSRFTVGEGSLGALETLYITNTKMMDMNFLATGGMRQLQKLYMRHLPATELTVPSGTLQKCTMLDMAENYELATLSFGDNTCPLVASGGFQLWDCFKLATLIVGDNVMNSYDCWHPAEGWLPVKTMIVGNNSLNAASRFGFSDVMETVQVGNNSFGKITTLTFQPGVGGGIKVIPPLRSLVVGENSFGGTAALMNLSDYTELKELSIGNGSFAKLTTLTLTGSGLTELAIDKDMLPGLKTLTLGSATADSCKVEQLTIGADALPNLTALNFCTNSASGSPLKNLTVGDGALKSLVTMSLAYSKHIEALQFGVNALGSAGTIDMGNAAAGLISFGQGSAPKLSSLKLNNAEIGKLYFGKDSCAGYTGASSPLLFGAASLKEFEAEEGAFKLLAAMSALPGNQLTSFITRGSALEKVSVLNFGTQPGMTQLEANLAGMAALKELYLEGTAIEELAIPDDSLQNTTKLTLPAATLKALRFGANTLPLYVGNGGAGGKTLLLNNAPVLESLVFGANSLPLPAAVDSSFNPQLIQFEAEDGALGGLKDLKLNDCPALQGIGVAPSALANIDSLDISHSGIRSLALGDGRYAKLTQLRAESMDDFCADNGGAFTIQNGELPQLQRLQIKGQRAMATLDIQAGSPGSPTLPNLVELSVAPLSAGYLPGYETTSLSQIKFNGYTMPKIESIELHNTPIRKIVLEANSMPGLKMFYPDAGTVFSQIETGANAAPNLYRFQKDNAELTSLHIGDGSCLNLGNPVPTALRALAGGDYDPLAGLDKNTFQSLKLGAGARPGVYLEQLDLTGFAAFTAFELASGCVLPDMEKLIITGTQLSAFPSLDEVGLPKLAQLHLFQNPITGAFAQASLPASLVELRLDHTNISSLDLSGSAMPNLAVLAADHCPALERVAINTPGSFGRQKMDVFKFSNCFNLTSMKLDPETVENLMDGMAGDGRSVIELYNTRLGYADILPLVHPKNTGSNVTIRLPDDFLQALENGEVPDNTAQGARVAMLYSEGSYNSGSGEAPLASSVLADNLYPVYRIQPEIFFAGMMNNQQGPYNGMAGTFEANQTEGGLEGYLSMLPESQAQGIRALLASGFPNSTLGLSANDAACATAEAIAAFLNESLPPELRVASNYNYDKTGELRMADLSYAEAPDPETNPEGYKLYSAVTQLLDQARFASAVPVDNTPAALSGEVTQALTPDPNDGNVATVIVRVTQKNINGRYIIADHSSNITMFERQVADGWEVISAPLSYRGDVDDVLRLTIDNTDKTAAVTLDLKAVNTVGQGQYYDVTDTDNDDYQNSKFKSDYIALRGAETTEYDDAMLLRAAEAVVTIRYKWMGQNGAIQASDTVRFANAKPGDKVYTNGSGEMSVSAPSVAGFASPEADCGEYLTVTGDGDEIIFYYKKPVSISGASGSRGYNGQTQTLSGIVTDLSGDTLTGLSATASGKNAGDYEVTVSGTPALASGKSFDALYQPTIASGKLTITKAELSVGAASGSFEYDATEHAVSGYRVVSGQLWGDDQLSVTLADNKRTDVGDSEPAIQSVSITSGGSAADANYIVDATAKGKLTVTARPLHIAVETQTFRYNGQEQKVSYTANGLVPGQTLQVTLDGGARMLAGSNDVSVASVRVLGAGEVTANYAITAGTGAITVLPLDITVKADSGSYLFDDAPHAVTSYQVSGDLVAGDTVSSVELLNNARAQVGEQTISVGAVKVMRGDVDVSSCYTITPVTGKVTVVMSDAEVIVTAKDATFRYDGQDHRGTEYTVTGLHPGDTLQSLNISGGGDEVGTYELLPAEATIVDAQGKVVRYYAKIAYVKGSLTITRRPATIAINSLSFPYDGQEHTVGFKSSGLLDNHEAHVKLAGAARRDPGRYDVTFDSSSPPAISWGNRNVTKNYSLTLTPGTLTILPKGSIVRIAARSVKANYDGAKHGADGYDVTGLLPGDHVSGVTVSGEGVNAGAYDLIPAGARILDAAGKDVTAGYQSIEYVSGKLTIAKRALSVSAESKSFPYDGQPHGVHYAVAGDLASGDAVTNVVLTGNARTQIGFNDVLVGKVSVERGGTDVSANYEVTKKSGVIQILPRNDLSYRVEYYYAGTLEHTAAYANQTLGATVSGYPEKPRTGFAFGRVQYGADYNASSLAIGLIEENNVIRVYYERAGGIGYTVEYHYQNAKGDGYDLGNVDSVGGMKVGDVISDINQRINAATLPGFVFERGEGLPLALTADKSQNVIRVYYNRVQNVAYRVEYYYNGKLDASATERYAGRVYGEVVRKYADKIKSGYALQSVETVPFGLTMYDELNVIRVYYDLVGGGEIPETIADAAIPLSAGMGSLNVGDSIE